jgi:uncharacterized protein (DUF169 family)
LQNRKIAKTLKDSLSLTTQPVAVKFHREFSSDLESEYVKKGFKRPSEPINVCQAVAMARFRGECLIYDSKDMACIIGGVALGLSMPNDAMRGGLTSSTLRLNRSLAQEFVSTVPRLPFGSSSGIACAPLSAFDIEPDCVAIYGNSYQIMRTIQAYLYDKGGRVEISSGGEYSGCADIIANTVITGKLQIGIPCFGERMTAGVADNELSVGIPYRDLQGISSLLEGWAGQHVISTHEIDKTPTYFPDSFLTEQAKSLKRAKNIPSWGQMR